MIIKASVGIMLMLVLTGCSAFRDTVSDFTKVMNERKIKTCAKWEAYLKARDIAGGKVEAVTVTGGADFEQCVEMWKGNI